MLAEEMGGFAIEADEDTAKAVDPGESALRFEA
jgi:hypothetical protein